MTPGRGFKEYCLFLENSYYFSKLALVAVKKHSVCGILKDKSLVKGITLTL